MKKMASLILLYMLLMSGCTKRRDRNTQQEAFSTIDWSACALSFHDQSEPNIFEVINSPEALANLVDLNAQTDLIGCTELNEQLKQIDFTRSTLLVGRQFTAQIEASLVEQRLSKNNATGKFTYHVIFQEGPFTATGFFRFGVIVPKVLRPEQVTLEMQSRPFSF